jgi:hypothetical protein
MQKLVDGKVVECTPEEEAAILAEWARADAESAASAVIAAERIARKTALDGEASTDQMIDRLRGATPDQIRAFVDANLIMFTAAQRAVIARMLIAIAYALNGGAAK